MNITFAAQMESTVISYWSSYISGPDCVIMNGPPDILRVS